MNMFVKCRRRRRWFGSLSSRRGCADAVRPGFLFSQQLLGRLAAPVVLVDVRLAPALVDRRRREARFAHGQARYAHLNLAGESLALYLADVCSLPDLRLLLVHERRGHATVCARARVCVCSRASVLDETSALCCVFLTPMKRDIHKKVFFSPSPLARDSRTGKK